MTILEQRILSQKQETEPLQSDWSIDLFSTILSRRHSYHRMAGKIRLTRIKKED